MDAQQALALAFDPTLIFTAQGYTCDPWQRELLFSTERQIILNCSRQAGKSTTIAALALHTALFQPKSLILLLSKAQRQAHELFRKVLDAYNAIGRPVPVIQDTQSISKIELANGSRIVGLPGKEDTVRSFSGVTLLIIDEAARVPDDLYNSVRPMLSVSQGRLVLLSTPFGQRGFFYREWHREKKDDPWRNRKGNRKGGNRKGSNPAGLPPSPRPFHDGRRFVNKLESATSSMRNVRPACRKTQRRHPASKRRLAREGSPIVGFRDALKWSGLPPSRSRRKI